MPFQSRLAVSSSSSFTSFSFSRVLVSSTAPTALLLGSLAVGGVELARCSARAFDLLLAVLILPCVKLLSRLFTALSLLPSMATLAFAQPHLAAQGNELRTDLLDGGAVVLAEVGDGSAIRNEASRQPHRLQIAASLTLQPPARLDPVEIAVDVELEHRRRMIRGPAGRCRINAIEPEVAKFQRIDEHIDRANRIASSTESSRHSGNSVVCWRSAP